MIELVDPAGTGFGPGCFLIIRVAQSGAEPTAMLALTFRLIVMGPSKDP